MDIQNQAFLFLNDDPESRPALIKALQRQEATGGCLSDAIDDPAAFRRDIWAAAAPASADEPAPWFDSMVQCLSDALEDPTAFRRDIWGVIRELPPWFDPVMDRLEELFRLDPGWDSYGAAAVKGQYAIRLLWILARLMSDRTPIPRLAPTTLGGISAEWYMDGFEIEITVETDDGSFEVLHVSRLPYERVADLRSWIATFEGGEQGR
jgi:hypothetical protein